MSKKCSSDSKSVTEVMIQLSYECNLHCRHCAYGDYSGTKTNRDFSWYNFLSKYNPKLIKISGGEPTLSPDWRSACNLAKYYDKVISFTNGTQRPKYHPHAYWVSLYSTRKIHNRITQADTFDTTIDFIKNHEVEYLNSPVFSRQQLKGLMEIGRILDIPLRLTRLISHGSCNEALRIDRQRKLIESLGLNEKPNWVTCSLGYEPSRCWKKMCYKPDGTEVVCTALIRGKLCPFRRKVSSDVWSKMFQH